MPVTRRLGALLAVVIALLWVAAPVARADEESVRHLDATFAIQPDGTVDVRYELQWHFAETGRHGITFGIATREPWGADDTMDAVYRVDDVRVSSPSGAPAEFSTSEAGEGRRTSTQVRIGDPDVALETQDATYVIEYTLRGALRTFETGPELHWDVTSPDYPTIERFTARVTAPSGVERVRCLDGPGECAGEVREGAGAYSAESPRGVLTVVAGFAADSVANAEPILEPARVTEATLDRFDATMEVRPDGRVDVTQRLSYRFPSGALPVRWAGQQVLVHQPWASGQSHAVRVRDLETTAADGSPVLTHLLPSPLDGSTQRGLLLVAALSGASEHEFTLSYTVDGAVVRDGDVARLRLQFAPDLEETTDARLAVTLPAAPHEVACRRVSTGELGRCSAPDHEVADSTVTFNDVASASGAYKITDISFPAAALTGPGATLVDHPDDALLSRARTGLIGGAGAAVGLGAVMLGVARSNRPRDERYAGTPPGEMGSDDQVRPVDAAEPTTVRFTPPDASLIEAGAVRDGHYRSTHLAATLVQMAVSGQLQLSSRPLNVVAVPDRRPSTEPERTIHEAAAAPGSRVDNRTMRAMRAAALASSTRVIGDAELWRHPDNRGRKRVLRLLAWVPWVLLIAGLLGVGVRYLPAAFGASFLPTMLAFLLVGSIAVKFARRRLPTRTRRARGTAMLDQVEGFRQYLATAEADQLDFEADRDIFRRYLPWAVLFGLTERWTRICRELAMQDRIDLDTSFLAGATLHTLDRDLDDFSSRVADSSTPSTSTSSSGGSGSSSGFSSSSSGGSGGGGTSASSW
ncbi:MAG: DUF2207 domain-containing protein [Propionibacteriaceae bacterium]|nr:DUF2207 domain-containing protein [Propionibacteriaceae bacterium]